MKLSRRVHRLERHRYAPELNTLVLKDGSRIGTPGATSISEALGQLGRGKQRRGAFAGISITYDFLLDSDIALAKQRRFFASRSHLLDFMRTNQGAVQTFERSYYVQKIAVMNVSRVRAVFA